MHEIALLVRRERQNADSHNRRTRTLYPSAALRSLVMINSSSEISISPLALAYLLKTFFCSSLLSATESGTTTSTFLDEDITATVCTNL